MLKNNVREEVTRHVRKGKKTEHPSAVNQMGNRSIKPDRNDIFYKIGMFYQKMNNYDDAILNYSKSIELNPLDKFSYHNIGVISIYKDNFKDAIENFSYAIDIDPTYNEAYFGRAYSYELSNKKLESETDYRTSLMINPSYRPSILGLERLTK